MKEFAKIFNTEKYGQILVTNDSRERDNGEYVPSLNFFFMINKDFGICEVNLKGKDTEESWSGFDDYFDNITDEQAIDTVKETIDNFIKK